MNESIPRCNTCKWFFDNGPDIECRRHAPVLGGGINGNHAKWPQVDRAEYGNTYCGDWEKIEKEEHMDPNCFIYDETRGRK